MPPRLLLVYAPSGRVHFLLKTLDLGPHLLRATLTLALPSHRIPLLELPKPTLSHVELHAGQSFLGSRLDQSCTGAHNLAQVYL